MKKFSVFIVLLICAANICCVHGKMTDSAASIKMKNIEGNYISDWEITKTAVELIITKNDNGYNYEIFTPYRPYGSIVEKIRFTDNPECFALVGIRWASWEIGGIPQELPEDVAVYIEEDGLLIQNHGGISMGNNSYLLFGDIKEKYIVLKNIYVALPNGAMVDRRITEDIVDMLFKRFEAIENGDVAAFRSTLGEMQDGVDYYYQLRLIFEFFGDLFDIDSDIFYDAVAYGSEELLEIADTLFCGEHPLRSRNTGLLIKKLEIIDTGGLRVTVTNNKNEEIIYDFTYW